MSDLITLTGDLTIHAAAEHQRRLAELMRPGIRRIDVSAVQSLDAAGVQLLLAAQRTVAGHGATLELENVPGDVAEVLGRCGLGYLVGGPAAAMPAGDAS